MTCKGVYLGCYEGMGNQTENTHMSYSLGSFKGGYIGDYIGSIIGLTKGDARSFDYSSHD